MRTTVTQDPDVERLIRDAMRKRGISFKEALNQAARLGLRGKEHKRAQMGEGQEFCWDQALAVAGAMEAEELNRKVSWPK